MIAAWMLYSIIVGFLVAGAALAAEGVCVALRRPVRFVWGAALAGTIALSTLALVASWASSNATEPVRTTLVAKAADGTAPTDAVSSGWLHDVRVAFSAREERVYGALARGTGDGRVLGLLWAAASLTLVALFLRALVRFRGARRRWRQQHVAGVSVYVASSSGPALVGLRHPEIVIPEWLLNASEADQRLVVQHEEEHRRARDHLFLAGACAAVCLFPWNPALWWMIRRTRLAIELDCDARVLRRGVRPRDYGALLLNVAARAPALPLAAPALADSRSHLERRIISMTRAHHGNAPRRAGIAALGAMFMALAACSADMPTAAEIDRMDVTDAESHLKVSGQLVDGEELVFIVDGVVTPADQARAIAPERIGSIEIVKGAAAREHGVEAADGVVHILTRKAGEAPATPGPSTKIRVRGQTPGTTGERLELKPYEASTLGENPLFILDGEVAPPDFRIGSIDPATIERIEVIKSPAALKVYGERGANGVVRITRKK